MNCLFGQSLAKWALNDGGVPISKGGFSWVKRKSWYWSLVGSFRNHQTKNAGIGCQTSDVATKNSWFYEQWWLHHQHNCWFLRPHFFQIWLLLTAHSMLHWMVHGKLRKPNFRARGVGGLTSHKFCIYSAIYISKPPTVMMNYGMCIWLVGKPSCNPLYLPTRLGPSYKLLYKPKLTIDIATMNQLSIT